MREDELMQQQIETLIQEIKADYIRFAEAANRGPIEKQTGYFAEQVANFEDLVTVKYGNKYIKIIKDGSVWGFIVNTEKDKKFQYGDILMAAGYTAPARNKARGNEFEDYSIAWTGPHYLV